MDSDSDKSLAELEALQRKMLDLQKEYEALTPEERAQVNSLVKQDESVSSFHDDLIAGVKDGSISTEDLLRWSDEAAEQLEEAYRRREWDHGSDSAEPSA